MKFQDFIKLNKTKVRSDSNLMLLYIDLFYQKFGYKPNCAGCSFNNDWVKFINTKTKNNFKIIEEMKSTFKLKRNDSEILWYKKDKQTFRIFANRATENFVKEYLVNGTESEIEERKKRFSLLPIEEEAVKVPKKRNKKK